jgi:hypothetical protein
LNILLGALVASVEVFMLRSGLGFACIAVVAGFAACGGDDNSNSNPVADAGDNNGNDGSSTFDASVAIDAPGFLVDPTDVTKGAKTVYSSSYLTNNTWVSGPLGPTDFTATFAISSIGGDYTIPITVGRIAMELSADHKTAKNGNFSGVIDLAAFEAVVKLAITQNDQVFCSSTAIDPIIAKIESAADILVDGSQDPNKPCDGISIGLGIEAVLSEIGTVAPAQPPPVDPCAG